MTLSLKEKNTESVEVIRVQTTILRNKNRAIKKRGWLGMNHIRVCLTTSVRMPSSAHHVVEWIGEGNKCREAFGKNFPKFSLPGKTESSHDCLPVTQHGFQMGGNTALKN